MPASGLLELRAKGNPCLLFFNITATRPDHESDGPIYVARSAQRG